MSHDRAEKQNNTSKQVKRYKSQVCLRINVEIYVNWNKSVHSIDTEEIFIVAFYSLFATEKLFKLLFGVRFVCALNI